jgi:hypothetical protein
MPLLIVTRIPVEKDDGLGDNQRGSVVDGSGRVRARKRALRCAPRLSRVGFAITAPLPEDEGLVDCVDTGVLPVYGDSGV